MFYISISFFLNAFSKLLNDMRISHFIMLSHIFSKIVMYEGTRILNTAWPNVQM